MIKRFLDIILSSIAIIILSPLLVPVMIILKLTGEGHIFYHQKRIGKNGELFNLYKFATMFKDSPNMTGGNITAKDDPRILPFGKFLRKHKINELPQIINVLLGDMSLIGILIVNLFIAKSNYVIVFLHSNGFFVYYTI